VSGAYRRIRGRFTKLASYSERVIASARRDGFIQTLFGYRITVPKSKAYVAINYRIQGSAGDVMKYAMLNCAKIKPAPMILTVHDELIFEVNRRYRRQPVPLMLRVKKAMEEPGTRIGIPTPVDISIVDKKWSEKRRIKLA
jgi:DNA polymerase I-like protein with 3'-5' exonuclease and polymerase domains